MKQHIAVFTLGLSLLTSCMTDSAYRKVENGLVADIRSGQAKAVKLEVISDDIIRVIASPDGKFSNQVNLIKDTKSLPAPSFQITTSGDTIIVSTQTTQARLSRETGEVRFTDANGHTILREKTNGGKEFTPIEVEGTKGYTLRQVFESEDEEGLYGLGQHQSDEFNYKGKNEELFQYNTKVSVPFIVSSKGYGVLWHNYSLSRFGDKRPYADLGDVFGLYGKDGRAGALTATYYTDKAKNSVLIQRDEDKVDYENLKTIKNLPADFPKPSASATWEGEIEAKETGTYHFKLHYAGYTKVFVNNEEIIPERWRAAWNPNDYKATAERVNQLLDQFLIRSFFWFIRLLHQCCAGFVQAVQVIRRLLLALLPLPAAAKKQHASQQYAKYPFHVRHLLHHVIQRNPHGKCRSLVFFAVYTDRSPVHDNRAPRNRKAKAGSADFPRVGLVHAVETLEDMRNRLLRDADAGVCHRHVEIFVIRI